MSMEQGLMQPGNLEILKELERFVVDNDELQELEETIGRFNIFDAEAQLAEIENALKPILS